MSVRTLTRGLLSQHPLPAVDGNDDKESRGRVLIIGGSTQVPGAVLLAGVAALRAGAGKLQLATVKDAAIPLGIALPEALVVALPVSKDGDISGARAARLLAPYLEQVDALLVGPGMLDEATTGAVLQVLVPALPSALTLVLDGAAVVALHRTPALLHALRGRVTLTPHAGEMASLLEMDKRVVEADAQRAAIDAASRFGATVALKGAETWIAEPDGVITRFHGGTSGLGTSGSGDTLAGVIVGLAARGASASTATMWGVWAHGAAGRRLAARMAPVGFLARELLAEVPLLVGGGDENSRNQESDRMLPKAR
jgi:ADP-dependent NAD(P)H-hydrate dehydratase